MAETSFLIQKIIRDEWNNHIQQNAAHFDEPLIQLVNSILSCAMQQSVSDIHIEPHGNECRIRYRHQGLLQEALNTPYSLTARLIARLKIMAHLDITEQRLPQDGRFQHNNMDIRINICPTFRGEKAVLRLLTVKQFDLNTLNLTPAQHTLLLEAITAQQGLILVTGTTGCGKTTTLYAILNHLNHPSRNICTIEDPVEFYLQGTNQLNVNAKIHFDFAKALRAILRQDPDIIMIGEIRDQETAEIAMHAAQTGHLVLSTLHANDALSVIARLQSIGISNQQIADTLRLIIAQRLVRVNSSDGNAHRTAKYKLIPVDTILRELIRNNKGKMAFLQHTEQHSILLPYPTSPTNEE